MATIRYEKRYNKFYVYEVTQYWDKELKKPRQKKKYLGVAEEKDGLYQKPGQKSKLPKTEEAILDFGDSYAITEVAKQTGIYNVIKDSLGEVESIMNLICYQITEGEAMQHCSDWYDANIASKIFPNAKTSSQDISRLIKNLGRQDLQKEFFKKYINHFFSDKSGILIDSTALPSSINSSLNNFGYASGGIEQKVSCLMLVDRETKLPIYFRAIQGDIPDISTLKTTIAEIKQLGLKPDSAILDAGFCSRDNLQFLCKEKVNFITRLPRAHSKAFNELVGNAKKMEISANAVKYGDRVVFIKSKEINLYDCKLYAYIILDPSKKNKDTQTALRDIAENMDKEDLLAMDDKLKHAGFFILLSSHKIDKSQILPNYYTRQAIEQIFGFAKSQNNILPLRVHDTQSIRGYLMLIFLALVVFIHMRQKLQDSFSINNALLLLRGLKAKIFDNQIIIQEPNKKVRDISLKLGIIMPTILGV